jgi:hypothetical protein
VSARAPRPADSARSLNARPASHSSATAEFAGGTQSISVPLDDRPFATRLDELRRRDNLTFRALEARLAACAEPGERGMNSGHLAGLTTGRRAPTPEVVSLVARAFGLLPQEFIEWRLWEIQQLFDPRRRGGLEAAVAELRDFLDRATPPAVEEPASRESRRQAHAVLTAAR